MASALAALRPLLKTRIDALALGVDVSYQGENFTVPTPSTMWVRVTVRWGNGEMVTGGTGVTGNHVTGVLFLEVFGTRGDMEAAEEMADTLRSSFSRAEIGAAKFFAPSGPEVLEDMATDRAAKWNRVRVLCPFELVEA